MDSLLRILVASLTKVPEVIDKIVYKGFKCQQTKIQMKNN